MNCLTHRSVIVLTAMLAQTASVAADDHPLTDKKRSALTKQLNDSIKSLQLELKENPESIESYSRRGNANFFLGRFQAAVDDYEKTVALNPQLEKSHWRRGIAYFYAEQYKQAAHQFEIYHTYDNVDRENGIWRFLSQSKSIGIEKARLGLLRYKKDDREPFPAVYQLFAGKTTPEEILADIRAAQVTDDEREKRLFYAQLYIGLNYYVEGKTKECQKHLREAVANKWGARPESGYGPNFMWHVGRVHYDLLLKAARPGG